MWSWIRYVSDLLKCDLRLNGQATCIRPVRHWYATNVIILRWSRREREDRSHSHQYPTTPGCDSAPTRFSVPTLLTLLHKTPWPKTLLSSFFLIFFLKREDCNCAGSVGKITLILQKELRYCLHCCWHPCLTLATSANNEWRRWPLSTLLRMRVTSGSFHVHTGDHKRSHLIGNVNGLAKKSNFFKKSELSIKPCSVNVALYSIWRPWFAC